MLALNLIEVKECMGKLLLHDTFDSFSFIEGDITTFITFHINGFIKKDFYDTVEQNNLTELGKTHASWGETRDYCFQLIKGNKVPLEFKFVLNFSSDNTKLLLQTHLPSLDPEEVTGLYLRFHYEHDNLTCITGTSTKTFSMDKTLEHLWDETASKYLKQKGLLFEVL